MPGRHRQTNRNKKSPPHNRDSKDRFSGSNSDGWQRSKLKGRNCRTTLLFSHEKDVTIDAYADNASSQALASRTSKATAISVNKEFKQIESASAILAAKAEEEIVDDWYERAFSDEEDARSGDVVDLGDEARGEGAEMEITIQEPNLPELENGHTVPLEKGKTLTPSYTGTHVYPSVIWYLVSPFIYPEDVATFACLCRDTYALTNTAAFWRKLYFRYYSTKAASNLPKELYPTSIERTFGLRSLVIRALQFLYPPFVRRSATKVTGLFSSNSLETLEGRIFMYHVSKRKAGNHIYYLKFQQSGLINSASPNVFDPDIQFNNHCGQCILMAKCKQSHHLEPERIMGKELTHASVQLGSGMSYSRLKLEFEEPSIGRGRPKNRRYSDRRREKTCVVLDPVVCVRVFHWWHPHFHEEFRTCEGAVSTYNMNIWNGR
ncbi:transmembrane protein 183B-like [Patiria miniata]|uniref:Transmembrane protein 183 n=1 Tax=Patiria miniata TaxID=46514 RepID=A0A913ZRL2_PATMI|nr:transmembrane protein 183B-like [Patiria miniata]